MHKLWNVLLYPAGLYQKLTDNKVTLVTGIILVGLIDFFLPDVKEAYKAYFTVLAGKTAVDIQFNIAAAVFVILLLGVIDVVFFSVPLYDVFRFFKKREGLPHRASAIKVMKVYIMSHFLLIPVSVILYYVFFRYITKNSSVPELILAEAASFAIMIWASAIITRGINVLYQFSPYLKRLTFLVVFTWGYLFDIVFNMQIMSWLLKIFK
ncbi:MAG: hypothetical protein FIA99_16790 [Ruminiclostridium sp.]|nr:hypothetical protein [Ruminiclostridium sp.]